MLHFVLADIDPTKASNFELFLKEMNEIAMLISVAGAPHVTHEALKINEETGLGLLALSEGDFEVKFKGKWQDGTVVSGYFELYEDQKRLLEISYSIRQGAAIALRTKLNCEGEYLVREELERAFERDFSQEAHVMMDTPLEELQKPKGETPELSIEENASIETEESSGFETLIEQNDPLISQAGEAIVEEEDLEEITEELTELTQKIQDAIKDTKYMIGMLNNLSHDLTRGATVNFGEFKTDTKTLENGAIVEIIDDESNDYRITFRKGSFDEMVEVSFFLEKGEELIFSVYFSTEGVGKISTTSSKSNIVFKKIKLHLL